MDLSSNDVLANLALLAMYAEDMHRDVQSAQDKLTPPFDQRLIVDWEPVAYLTARDAIIPPPGVKLPITMGSDPLYYGYLAQNRTNPDQWVVGVRGTAGLAEWVIDGQFLWVPHPRVPNAKVEHGFWDIYNSMVLTDLSGTVIDQNAAQGLAEKIGVGEVLVVGHSLGSALATYLTYDLAALMGQRVQGCFFASPRTGDPTWTTAFDGAVVGGYRVVNYVLDVVPHLPTRPGYATLPKSLQLDPKNMDASIKLDVGCNHHVICYCAMLSLAKMRSTTLDATIDGPSAACVIGDKSMISDEVRSMAAAIEFLMSTGLHVSALFRGMFSLGV